MRPGEFWFCPVGSAGDVLPLAGLGAELQRRGHRVVVHTNALFAEICAALQLPFEELGTAAEAKAVLEAPGLWQAGPSSVRLALGAADGLVRRTFARIGTHPDPGRLTVVHGALGFGARLAGAVLGVRTVTVQLAPGAMKSVEDPPHLPGFLALPRWLPRAVVRAYWALGDRMIDPLLEKLHALRAELGLPRVRGVLTEWVNSPELTLGFFPEWFAGRPRDWPDSIRLVGFPLFDAAGAVPLPDTVEAFLSAVAPAGGPIVFTPGSANFQARRFFAMAVEVCEALQRPGLLLTRERGQVPARLPASVHWAQYAPFSAVFSRAAAVVHHGGIGTVAQALAAGVPQLITAMAFDQYDNGARVERLGAGAWVPFGRATSRRVVSILGRLLVSSPVQSKCQELARAFAAENAISRACDAIEELASRRLA